MLRNEIIKKKQKTKVLNCPNKEFEDCLETGRLLK